MLLTSLAIFLTIVMTLAVLPALLLTAYVVQQIWLDLTNAVYGVVAYWYGMLRTLKFMGDTVRHQDRSLVRAVMAQLDKCQHQLSSMVVANEARKKIELAVQAVQLVTSPAETLDVAGTPPQAVSTPPEQAAPTPRRNPPRQCRS